MFNENINAVELSDEQLQTVNGGVVIAIIAILIGLLLPAVQSVRTN